MSIAALVSKFDDIVHATTVLTEGIESDFIKFVTSQEYCRVRWLEAENELVKYKQENTKLRAENDTLQIKLKHTRNQVDIEMKKRMKAEAGMDQMENNFVLIKELLCDKDTLSRMNENARNTLMQISQCHNETYSTARRREFNDDSQASILSDSSIDPSGDDLDATIWKVGRKLKRSSLLAQQQNGSIGNKHVDEAEEHDGPPPSKVTKTVPSEIHEPAFMQPAEPEMTEPVEPVDVQLTRPDTETPQTPTVDHELLMKGRGLYPDIADLVDTTPSAPPCIQSGKFTFTPSQNSLNSLKPKNKKKTHSFQSKTVIKPESCIVCGRKITFSKLALKCRDCRGVCHPDCKLRMPLPCVPVLHTPGSGKKGQEHTLDFYAPPNSPMVPHLVVKCVQEIEKRGLNEVGIYRVPGAEIKVKEMKEKFLRGKTLPDLGKVADIHVVCGVVKDFLRHLAEPLVTFKLHQEFMEAGSKPDMEDGACEMYQVVSKLPQANRETLAFMIRHLQRISQCPDCKMTTQNLARVFGPTLIGHNCANPEPMQMLQDTKCQPQVVECLMSLPSDYWNQFLNNNDENAISPAFNPNTHLQDGTPIYRVPSSMLGPLDSDTPVGPPSVKKKGSFLSKTPLTPRTGSKSKRSKRPNHFFSSLSSPNL